MFNQFVKYTLLITTLLITGCSTQSHKIWLQPTDALVSNGNYKKALEQLSAEGKNKTKHFKSIQNQSERSSQNAIFSIENAISKKLWGKAKEQLAVLIENHPWDSNFNTLNRRLKSEKANEIRLMETKLVLAKAQLLQAELLEYEFNLRDKNTSSDWSLKKLLLKNEKKDIAQSLYRLSVSALRKFDYLNAQRTYSQALELDNNLEGFPISKTIHEGINKTSRDTILKKQNILLEQLNSALETNDYTKVITLHGILSNAPFKGRNVNIALKKATKSRFTQAQKIDKEADSVYRSGDIKEAIRLWKQAKLLAPDLNSLQEKLARAEKVNTKLVHLRQQAD